MAEAIPLEGESFHGVLHKMTLEQMTALDKIEGGYDRCAGKAKLYDDNIMDDVTVYCRPGREKNADIDKAPTERYIDIMT